MIPIDSQAYCPWNETGYLYTSVRNAGNVSVMLPRCAFYPKGSQEKQASNGVYVVENSVAAFGFSDLIASGIVPKVGDTITPPHGTALIVEEVLKRPYTQSYRIALVKMQVQISMADLATIFRTTPTSDASGRVVPNFAAVYTAIACKFQPESAENVDNVLGGQRTRRVATAYFNSGVTLQAGDQIEAVGGDATVFGRYAIKSQGDIGQLAELTSAVCERIA